ncbi:MFS transporter [Nocardia sp. NPDC020380]|uniref:MFS transporter n=1 Tax=Nocardia sp. NPDC020380 TaxID=3364309 RepID=UPI0037BC7418
MTGQSTSDLSIARKVVSGRDFRLLWLGQTVSLLGSNVSTVALPLVMVVTLGAGTFTVGLLTSVAWLPWLVIGLPAGAWVDRLARRPVMLWCDVVSLVAVMTVPVAAWFGVLTVGQLFVVAAVGGCAKVFFTTAYRAYLPSLVPGDELMAANSRLYGSEATVQVVGPGLGGVLASVFGAVSGLVVDALSFGVSAVCLWGIRAEEPRPAVTGRGGLRKEIGEGLRFVVRDPYLRVLVCYSAAVNIALMGFTSISVLFLVRDVGAGAGTVGVVLALSSGGGAIGAVLAGRISGRFGSARAVVLLQAATVPMGLLIPLTGAGFGLVWYVAGVLAIEIGGVASNVIINTFRQQYCPPELLGRINASMAMVTVGVVPLGGVLAGGLGTVFGVRQAIWMMTGLLALSVVILLMSRIRGLRDFPATRSV